MSTKIQNETPTMIVLPRWGRYLHCALNTRSEPLAKAGDGCVRYTRALYYMQRKAAAAACFSLFENPFVTHATPHRPVTSYAPICLPHVPRPPST